MPTSLSPQGFREVYKDPELLALLQKEADSLGPLIRQNVSFECSCLGDRVIGWLVKMASFTGCLKMRSMTMIVVPFFRARAKGTERRC